MKPEDHIFEDEAYAQYLLLHGLFYCDRPDNSDDKKQAFYIKNLSFYIKSLNFFLRPSVLGFIIKKCIPRHVEYRRWRSNTGKKSSYDALSTALYDENASLFYVVLTGRIADHLRFTVNLTYLKQLLSIFPHNHAMIWMAAAQNKKIMQALYDSFTSHDCIDECNFLFMLAEKDNAIKNLTQTLLARQCLKKWIASERAVLEAYRALKKICGQGSMTLHYFLSEAISREFIEYLASDACIAARKNKQSIDTEPSSLLSIIEAYQVLICASNQTAFQLLTQCLFNNHSNPLLEDHRLWQDFFSMEKLLSLFPDQKERMQTEFFKKNILPSGALSTENTLHRILDVARASEMLCLEATGKKRLLRAMLKTETWTGFFLQYFTKPDEDMKNTYHPEENFPAQWERVLSNSVSSRKLPCLEQDHGRTQHIIRTSTDPQPALLLPQTVEQEITALIQAMGGCFTEHADQLQKTARHSWQTLYEQNFCTCKKTRKAFSAVWTTGLPMMMRRTQEGDLRHLGEARQTEDHSHDVHLVNTFSEPTTGCSNSLHRPLPSDFESDDDLSQCTEPTPAPMGQSCENQTKTAGSKPTTCQKTLSSAYLSALPILFTKRQSDDPTTGLTVASATPSKAR